MPTANSSTAPTETAASRQRAPLQRGHPRYQHVRIAGVTISTPPLSPTHHVHHRAKARAQLRYPPRHKLVTPHAEPTRHIASAMATKTRVSLTRSKGLR